MKKLSLQKNVTSHRISDSSIFSVFCPVSGLKIEGRKSSSTRRQDVNIKKLKYQNKKSRTKKKRTFTNINELHEKKIIVEKFRNTRQL